MYKIFENPTKIFALTKEGTRELYDNLYDEMIEEGKDVVDYQALKAMSTGVLCPDCNSSHVIKNGLQSGVQNYRCKNCGRQFRVTTGTFMYGVHEKDKMLEYIKCMSAGMSLRECARIVHISLTTSFFWRHRILCALQSFEDNVNFFGIVELEELLMNYSEKGKKRRDKKELKKLKKKKPEKVAIIAATDRSGNILFKKLEDNRVQAEHISVFLKSRISENSVICGSNKKAFKTVNAEHIKHKEITNKNKMKKGIYSVSTIHKKITDFVGWIYYKFRGVATKYLTNYIMWFVIKGKYLAEKLIEDTGRLLNLAASDRRAWERYSALMSQTYLIYNI
ncbi:MAG TPA: IS1595 family transposase [Bacteroidales bacterium]|jgi:transposase-like protein|nr:IS1595 family transposase [Bacteroidales bacterium]HOB26551.1 IS1595 family transposase [Bacteroidales bacterium]HOK22291.1 IS1595 family transposase [Bacteroidales bacterium]HPZ35707.1 IS1595 family transposase [Bacteroidales bacterium]